MDAEAASIYAFVRSDDSTFVCDVREVVRRDLPIREGNEHRVYRANLRGEHAYEITHLANMVDENTLRSSISFDGSCSTDLHRSSMPGWRIAS